MYDMSDTPSAEGWCFSTTSIVAPPNWGSGEGGRSVAGLAGAAGVITSAPEIIIGSGGGASIVISNSCRGSARLAYGGSSRRVIGLGRPSPGIPCRMAISTMYGRGESRAFLKKVSAFI